MKNDELIHLWQKGSDRMFREEKTDRDMITQYLNERTLKGNRSMYFNLIFYGAIHLGNIILLSLNLAGYQNNSSMIWILIAQLAITIGSLVFSMDVYYKFREINNYSETLQNLIQKQLWFYRKPYEIWLFLATLAAMILMINLNLYVDNDNGSYVIHNKLLFAGLMVAVFLFIYGALKVTSLLGLRKLKAYLSDLQSGVLDQSERMEQTRKRFLWLWIVVFLLLTAFMVLGILKAVLHFQYILGKVVPQRPQALFQVEILNLPPVLQVHQQRMTAPVLVYRNHDPEEFIVVSIYHCIGNSWRNSGLIAQVDQGSSGIFGQGPEAADHR